MEDATATLPELCSRSFEDSEGATVGSTGDEAVVAAVAAVVRAAALNYY